MTRQLAAFRATNDNGGTRDDDRARYLKKHLKLNFFGYIWIEDARHCLRILKIARQTRNDTEIESMLNRTHRPRGLRRGAEV